jgi:hypothetical protein
MRSGNDVIVRWFAPILFGPFIGASIFATIKAILNVSLVAWPVYLMIAFGVAVVQVLVFATVDITLLWMRLRLLPTGTPAWWQAIVAPVIVGLATNLFPRPQPAFIGFIIALIVIGPMLVTTIGMRVFFGTKPG